MSPVTSRRGAAKTAAIATELLHRMQIRDATLSVLSWKQHAVLRRTLRTFADNGIAALFHHRRIFFNEIDDADRAIAAEFGFEAIGEAENVGIYGGAKGLAEACVTEFMLFVENDCPAIVAADAFHDAVTRSIADMRTHQSPVFSLRSRRQPGEKFDRHVRYQKYYRLEQPLRASETEPLAPRDPTGILQRSYEDLRRPSLRGTALFAEEQPHLRHPALIRRSDNGNFLTTSRVLNWSNNCLLVHTEFMRDVVLKRVESHPAPTSINGHQDIEAAVKLNRWWRQLDVTMGQAEPGPLTHSRGSR